MSASLDEQFTIIFSCFHLCPGCRKNLKGKIYLAMDLPVHGESDGVSFILVEDCICKLLPFN